MCLAAAAQGGHTGEFQSLLKQGFELHQQAHFAEAIPVLERARRLEPGDYFANLLLGVDLLRTGNATESIPRLKLAARVKPGEDTPEEYLGEAEASLGAYALAVEAYQQAMERGHGAEDALEAWAGFALERFRRLGENLRASEAGVEAIRSLRHDAAKPEAEPACLGSIANLERKVALKPVGAASVEVEAAHALSLCYALEAGKASTALQSRSTNAAVLDRLRGDVLLRLKGDATAAAEEYRKAIALRPGDPALLARLSEAQLMAGDLENARQTALSSLAIDPHRPDALRTLISLAMDNRDYEQALPWLKQLSLEAPGDGTVQVELAKALSQTGNAGEGLRRLASALAAGYPDEKGSLHALEAKLLRQLGRDNEAAKASAESQRLSDSFQAHRKDGTNASMHAEQ